MNNFFEDISIDLFFENYWRKKPLFIKGGALKFLGRNFSYSEFYRLAENVVKDTPKDLRGTPEKVIFIQQINKISKFLDDHLQECKSTFNNESVWYDIIYAKNENSIGSHFDHSDNFVLQQQGSKIWRIFDKSIIPFEEKRNRMLNQTGVGHFDMPSEGFIEYVLNQGDLLYIPLFWVHQGISAGESLSISLVANAQLTINDLAEQMVELCVREDELVFPNHLIKSNIQKVDYYISYLKNMIVNLSEMKQQQHFLNENINEINNCKIVNLSINNNKLVEILSSDEYFVPFSFSNEFFDSIVNQSLFQFYLKKSLQIIEFIYLKSNNKKEVQQFMDFLFTLSTQQITLFYKNPIWIYFLNKTEININGRHYLIEKSSNWLGVIMLNFIITSRLGKLNTNSFFGCLYEKEILIQNSVHSILIPNQNVFNLESKLIITDELTTEYLNLSEVNDFINNNNSRALFEHSFIQDFFIDLSGTILLQKDAMPYKRCQELFTMYYKQLEEHNLDWIFDTVQFLYLPLDISNITHFQFSQVLYFNNNTTDDEFNLSISIKLMSYLVFCINYKYPFNDSTKRISYENQTTRNYFRSLESMLGCSLYRFLYKDEDAFLYNNINSLKEELFLFTNNENIGYLNDILTKLKIL